MFNGQCANSFMKKVSYFYGSRWDFLASCRRALGQLLIPLDPFFKTFQDRYHIHRGSFFFSDVSFQVPSQIIFIIYLSLTVISFSVLSQIRITVPSHAHPRYFRVAFYMWLMLPKYLYRKLQAKEQKRKGGLYAKSLKAKK